MGLLDDAIKEHLDLQRRRGADPAEIEKAEREALGPVRREAVTGAVPGEAAPLTAGLSDAQAADDEFDFGIEPGDITDDARTTVAPAVPALDAIESDSAPAGIAAPDYEQADFDEFAGSDASPAEIADEEPPARQAIAAMPDLDHKPKRRGLFHRRSHEDTDFEATTPLPAELPADDPFADEPEDMEARESEAVGRAQPIERDESTSPAPPPSRAQPPALRITPDVELGHTVEYDVEQAFAEEDVDDDEDILEETPDFLADTPDHDRLWFEQKPPPDFDFDH